MILSNKKVIGSRLPRSFHSGKVLAVPYTGDTVKSWVLSTANNTFVFKQDPQTGVRLHSWSTTGYSQPTVNSSANLWTMGLLESYRYSPGSSDIFWTSYVLYPSAENFDASLASAPEVSGTTSSFTFVWRNIQYDRKNKDFTCNIEVTASVDNTELDKSLSISVRCTANQTYTAKSLEQGNSVAVQYISFPSLAIKKSSDETYNANTVFTSPSILGYTYHNPHKYLRTPRFQDESFQYNELATRSYSAGESGFPRVSIIKYNFASPGGLTMPAFVFGNRSTKEGVVIHALDSVGTNPKSYQYYVDENSLHLKSCHVSDDILDPNGVGGYANLLSTTKASLTNAPTWTWRIRPFVSPTRWVDWYGYELYKDEVVPLQESYGWMPKSFYERYVANEITKEMAETPMVFNAFGFTTGNLDELDVSFAFYKTIAQNATIPAQTGRFIAPTHITPVTYNFIPRRNTDPSSVQATYNSWEPWAGLGTGVDVTGPEPYKPPDYDSINPKWETGLSNLIDHGSINYSYSIFPYPVSSGSVWTQNNNAQDLVHKSTYTEDVTVTYSDYKDWAYNGVASGFFGGGFDACLGVDLCRDKFYEIGYAMGTYGLSFYHDTLGLFGRGCVAKHHTYGTDVPTVVTHPRSVFSKYYNDKQLEWVSGFAEYSSSGFNSAFDPDSAGPNAVRPEDWKFANSAEIFTDCLLKFVPIYLVAERLGPYLSLFFNKYNRDSGPRSDCRKNLFLGTVIDSYSDVQIQALTGFTDYWSCFIKPPNWVQRCPASQIVYSDRSIHNEFAAVYTSNTLPNFFTGTNPIATGTYGQLTYPTGTTEEQQKLDWGHFTVTQWPYANRISAWHLSDQFDYINPNYAYGDINTNESEVLYSGVWSGYTVNLIQKLYRIQEYNPDYFYHGRYRHLLDDYESEFNAEAATSVEYVRPQLPNLKDPFTRIDGSEKVQHFVREHRSNGNLLIGIGNWYSGTSSFSGTFNPASYGLTKSYQIYSLDVNSSNHGTKTLEAVVEADAEFVIDLELGTYEYKVYEIEVNQLLLDNEAFSSLTTSYSPVTYSYGLQEVISNSLTFAYSYGSSTLGEIEEPIAGFKAPATQQILNNLPHWMKMRQSYESDGWKLTNSWGMGLEQVLDNVADNTTNLNIITAQTYPISHLNYIDLSASSVSADRTPRNLLFNSSFTVKDVSRTDMPMGWDKFDPYLDTRISFTSSTVSCCSLIAQNGSLKIGQEITLNNVMVGTMYASVYIKVNCPNPNVILHTSIEKTNGTSFSRKATHTNRSTEWVRLVLPLDISEQVYRVNLSILSSSDGEVAIAAPQLEVGNISEWTRGINDVLPYMPSTPPFSIVFADATSDRPKKIPIFPVAFEEDFREVSIPTRVEKTKPPTRNIYPFSSAAYGRKVNQQGEVTRTEFAVVESQIVERAISPTPWDIFGKYDIRDLRVFEELQYGTRENLGVTIVPITSAVRKDHLYVVCKETYLGTERYVIKILTPKTPPNNETYLESLIDFDLRLDFSKVVATNQETEEIYAISFSDVDPTILVITTTNNINYYYRLYFDYYYYNPRKGRIYLVEKYPDAKISVL